MAKKEFDKYIVFKREDLDVVFDRNPQLKRYFDTVISLIEVYRITHNKKPKNQYIVCNQDEPYAEKVWQAILEGEDTK